MAHDIVIYIGHHAAEAVTIIIATISTERLHFHTRRRKKKARRTHGVHRR